MKYQQHMIIDGYNYIFRSGPQILSNENALWQAREELVQRIIAWRGNKRIQFTIVFDGQDIRGICKTPRPHGIHVAFSQAPQKADPMIIDRVEKATNKRDMIVVTSDRALANVVRSLGCLVWSSEILASKLDNPGNKREYQKKYDANISPQELDEWIDLFDRDEPAND